MSKPAATEHDIVLTNPTRLAIVSGALTRTPLSAIAQHSTWPAHPWGRQAVHLAHAGYITVTVSRDGAGNRVKWVTTTHLGRTRLAEHAEAVLAGLPQPPAAADNSLAATPTTPSATGRRSSLHDIGDGRTAVLSLAMGAFLFSVRERLHWSVPAMMNTLALPDVTDSAFQRHENGVTPTSIARFVDMCLSYRVPPDDALDEVCHQVFNTPVAVSVDIVRLADVTGGPVKALSPWARRTSVTARPTRVLDIPSGVLPWLAALCHTDVRDVEQALHAL